VVIYFLLQRITEAETRFYMTHLMQGVQYLHDQRVIHRDLKTGNVLLNHELKVKICDFGLAVKLDHDAEMVNESCGTPNYIAPEILDKEPYSYPVDIWSLGVILYTLVIGRPPFETDAVKTTCSRIRNVIYYFPTRVQVSGEFKNLVQAILKRRDRSTLDDMINHPFFQNTPNELPLSALVMEPKNL